jgi:hypothetical protein
MLTTKWHSYKALHKPNQLIYGTGSVVVIITLWN